MKQGIFLINRGSGGNDRGIDAEEVGRRAVECFAEAGRKLEVRLVEPKQIESELARVVEGKPDFLIVAGGDGSVAAAAKAVGGTGIALGVVPMGTFNLAARDLGVPLEWEKALEYLAVAEPFAMDVLEVSGRSCLCTLILGFYPEYSHLFAKRDHGGQWWRKIFRMVTGLRTAFTGAKTLELEWDGPEGSGFARTKFASFVPGRYLDTAGLIPDRTGFLSGRLTGYIGTQRDAAAAMKAAFSYVIGRHEENPEIHLISDSRLILRERKRRKTRVMLDGEILTLSYPIELEIRSGYLRVMTTAEIHEAKATLAS